MMTNTDTTQKPAKVIGVYSTAIERNTRASKLTAKGMAIRTGEYQTVDGSARYYITKGGK